LIAVLTGIFFFTGIAIVAGIEGEAELSPA
jgi:hypothetical protein